jgi:membrane associated rhomboid family serine protease
MKKNNILWGNDRNAVIALLAINFVVFVFFRMLYIIFQNNPAMHLKDYNSVLINFGLSSELSVFGRKIWTLCTYFITNTTFLGLFINMLWLFGLSYLLQLLADNKYLIPSYVYGGVVGGIVFIITCQFAQSNTMLLGSATAILSLAGTLTALAPQYRLLPHIGQAGIPLWVLIVLYLIIDLLSTAFTNPVAIPAHIAGYAAGYGYGYLANRGTDLGNWMYTLYDLLLGKDFVPKTNKDQQYYQQKTVPYTKELKVNEQNINSILDKINATGMDSLTNQEKEVLQKAQNNYNNIE